MKFNDLLKIVGNEVVFESGLLMSGDVNERDVRKQLSRWALSGKLIQIRRGLYALSPPHQKYFPHPFVIANRLVRGSYVSCESALAYYGLIPENVPVIVSVSLSRPGRWTTPLGTFQYHHIDQKYHYGYRMIQEQFNQETLIAAPEKALLDLVYLKKQGDQSAYLNSLRLQNLDQLNPDILRIYADKSKSKKLIRAAERLIVIIKEENKGYRLL